MDSFSLGPLIFDLLYSLEIPIRCVWVTRPTEIISSRFFFIFFPRFENITERGCSRSRSHCQGDAFSVGRVYKRDYIDDRVWLFMWVISADLCTYKCAVRTVIRCRLLSPALLIYLYTVLTSLDFRNEFNICARSRMSYSDEWSHPNTCLYASFL